MRFEKTHIVQLIKHTKKKNEIYFFASYRTTTEAEWVYRVLIAIPQPRPYGDGMGRESLCATPVACITNYIRYSENAIIQCQELQTYTQRNKQKEIMRIFLQVNRPLSMKKDGIQTRKRKPKTPGKSKSPSKDSQHNSQPEPSLAPPMYTPPQVTSAYHPPQPPSQGLLDLSVARSDPGDNHTTGARYISIPSLQRFVDSDRRARILNSSSYNPVFIT